MDYIKRFKKLKTLHFLNIFFILNVSLLVRVHLLLFDIRVFCHFISPHEGSTVAMPWQFLLSR